MEKIFFLLYSFLTLVLTLLFLPLILLLTFKDKYKKSLPARFLGWRNPPLSAGGIWFHSCSFGEAKAIKPLVDSLPTSVLRMSTTTGTGYSAISEYTSESRYLPFESLLFFWLKPQKALVVMEAEFWYLLFALAKRRGAKTMLINARMSDRSYPKYLKLAWFYRYIFNHIDEVYAQTPKDKERLESLGASNVRVTGNIKLSQSPTVTQHLTKPSNLVVCGASTHEGEEALILDAFASLKAQEPDAILFLVPRHPERFEQIAQSVTIFGERHGYSHQRYSQNEVLGSDIVLVDVLGALVNIYAISDIVILGGAFAPIGGHNAGEPAYFGCKIISGKHYFNQKDIFEAIEGIAVVEASNLSRRLLQHGLLKPAKIKGQSDITPIIESLRKVL